MFKPLVSIIIINYNYERFLGEAIASALNQTYGRIEVIVVDDGSNDNSRSVIESYGKDVLTVFKPNEGQASALNAGFAESAGSIVCFLDSDDLFLPTKVAEIVDAYEKEPAAGWCFHPLQWVDAAAQTIPGSPDLLYATGKYDFRREYLRGKAKFYAPATSGLTFSRSILEKLFPIPQYVHICDNYLKLSAPAFKPGFYISKCLGLQRIHDENMYTAKKDPLLHATFQLSIARGLRDHCPELTRVANKVFANAIASKWKAGAGFQELSAELRQFLVSRPSAEKIEVLVHTAYRILHPYHLNVSTLSNRPIQPRTIH